MINTAEEFVKLRESENPKEYNRAAREPAPIQIWLDVIHDYPNMRVWVAHNKTVPIEILEILSDDDDNRVRGMVAAKRKLPENIQVKMAADKDESVRLTIARQPKATRTVLELLVNDPWVQYAKSFRKGLSRKTLKIHFEGEYFLCFTS